MKWPNSATSDEVTCITYPTYTVHDQARAWVLLALWWPVGRWVPPLPCVKHAGPSPGVPGFISVIIKDCLSMSKPLLMAACQEISPAPFPHSPWPPFEMLTKAGSIKMSGLPIGVTGHPDGLVERLGTGPGHCPDVGVGRCACGWWGWRAPGGGREAHE